MFEGIDLYEIRYAAQGAANSLNGLQIEGENLISTEGMVTGQVFLKDCSYFLDGVSRVCPFFPITAMAQQHLLYIQSFSYWEAGATYYTSRKGLDSYLLVYTYEGCGKLQYQGKTHLLRSGDCFLIDGREKHLYYTEKAPWKHSVLHFSGATAETLFQGIMAQDGAVFHLSQNVGYQHQLERMLRSYSEINPYREYQVSAHLTNLLLSIMTSSEAYQRSQQKMPDQIKDMVHYLNRSYSKDISLDSLSESFAISKYHLCRSFKKYTGFSPYEYLTQLRLERAKELLRTTSLPANQICAIVGIADENYFYRLFKKHTGQSPAQYRKE